MKDTLTVAKSKLAQMKKTRKLLFAVSLIAAIASLVVLILFNFMPAVNLTVAGTDKFGNGFDYPGWQLIYYGIGIQYIPGYYEFGFDIWTCLGMFVPILAILICTIRYGAGKNKEKARREFIMAAALIFGALILVNCRFFAEMVASSEGLSSFKDSYLTPAIEAGTFTLLTFPKVMCAVCLISAAIKIGNGCFLLHQKAYAKQYSPMIKAAEEVPATGADVTEVSPKTNTTK